MQAPVPPGFTLVRRIGPFDAETLPRGLLGEHRLKPDRWGQVLLHSGRVQLVWDDGSGRAEDLIAPAEVLVPPEVPHHLVLQGDIRLEIAFLQRED